MSQPESSGSVRPTVVRASGRHRGGLGRRDLALARACSGRGRSSDKLRVRVWSEGTAPHSVYPSDVDGAIGDHLRRLQGVLGRAGPALRPLGGAVRPGELDATDVLDLVGPAPPRRRPRIPSAGGGRPGPGGSSLGFVALHASCGSKPFQELMGGHLRARRLARRRPTRAGDRCEAPDHEIARGDRPVHDPEDRHVRSSRSRSPSPTRSCSWSRSSKAARPSGAAWPGTWAGDRVAYFRPGARRLPRAVPPLGPQGDRQRCPMGCSLGDLTSGRIATGRRMKRWLGVPP